MKKRVRIYKAGGQKGQYINPTAKWMMQIGGQPQAQSEISDEQISAYVQNALMQDADPNDIYKSLLQSGVDKNKANQIISSIVEYINEARKVEMADKTGQPELAQKEAEEMAALERAAAEEDAQRARQMQMMQTVMEDTQADEDMFTNDLIDDYIEGNDEQMMYGGQPLPSKSKFVKQAMKEYKKGGAIGQGQKPDEASLNAATNFIQSVNKESNEAKIKQEAEQYYDNVMLPQARRGKEMRTQRMLNRGLNQILGGASNMGMTNPYMYSEANPYGAQLKTANIDVRKTGLFGRPKQYSVQFDWDYINQPQLIEDAIDLEVSNVEDEVKDTQKQQVAKKNETTSTNSRLKELAKKRASGEVKSSGSTKGGGTKKATTKTEPKVETEEVTQETEIETESNSWDKNNNGIPDRVERRQAESDYKPYIRENTSGQRKFTPQELIAAQREQQLQNKQAQYFIDNPVSPEDEFGNKLKLPGINAPIPKSMADAEGMIQRKEIIPESLASTRVKQARQAEERKQERIRLQEDYAKRQANPEYNSFTGLPGESWRETLAAEAAPMEAMFRVSNEDNFFDDYINPAAWVGYMAKGLGEAPKQAKETDSYLPYVTGIGTPLLGGALGSIGTKTTGQFANNLVNPLSDIYVGRRSNVVKPGISGQDLLPVNRELMRKAQYQPQTVPDPNFQLTGFERGTKRSAVPTPVKSNIPDDAIPFKPVEVKVKRPVSGEQLSLFDDVPASTPKAKSSTGAKKSSTSQSTNKQVVDSSGNNVVNKDGSIKAETKQKVSKVKHEAFVDDAGELLIYPPNHGKDMSKAQVDKWYDDNLEVIANSYKKKKLKTLQNIDEAFPTSASRYYNPSVKQAVEAAPATTASSVSTTGQKTAAQHADDLDKMIQGLQQGGMYNQFGGAVNPFTLDPTGLTKFIYGGSNDLTMYKTGKEKQDEFWTKHYRKPDTGEIINQETGAVVTLPDFTDDVTTQTGTSDYEKRIKELENQLAGFKSNAGVARDMYGRQLPPPLFNRRARDLAGMGSFLGMAGVLNPFEYVGSWNQTSMYDPNTGQTLSPDAFKGLLPTNIKVKSGLFKPVKNFEIEFGMPGSGSMSKDELKKQRNEQLITNGSSNNIDSNNSFSDIDSKGRLLREKEDTRYNRMSDKKWNKFKEKESKKNIPEDYVSPETEINLSDLSSIQTNQKPIGVGNNILGKENLIMPKVPIESLPARPIVSSANQIQGIEALRNYTPFTNTQTTTQPVLQQEISNLINSSTSEDFNSWLSRNAMVPSIPPADMANNPNIGLDLLAAEDYPTRLMNSISNESNSNIDRIINNDVAYRNYLNKDIMETLPEGYSFRESDNTLMFPFSDTSPAPRNPKVTKTVSTNDPISRRMNAGISINKLKDEVFPGRPNLRNEMQSIVSSYSQENNIPEENFKQYQRLSPEQKLELINKAKNSGKKDLYEILIYLADAGSNSSSDDALGQAKKGGMPKFQTTGEVNLYTSDPYEEEDEALLNYGVENDYGTLTIPDYTQTPELMTEEGYNDYFSPSQTIQRQSDMIGTGSGTATVKPKSAILKGKVKDTYTFDPKAGLDLFNVAAYKVLQNRERPDMTRFMGTNIYDSNMDVADKGTYDIDSGLFRPGRMGFEGVVQKGGAINDEIYMTEEEIEEFLRNGGQLEYL